MKLSRGVLYMAASAFGFSLMSVLVKLASVRLPIGEVVLARCVVTLVASYVMVVRAGLPPWGHHKAKLCLRGLLGFCGLSGYYVALSRLPLADATTIQHTTPLVTAVLAWRILGEPIGRATLVALACGITGVLLIVHPSGAGLDPLGVTVGLAAAMCSAVAYVTVRQLARTEHALVIVFYFPLVATPLAAPWAAADWVTPTALELLLLLAIGLTTQFGQVFLTMALTVERAGRATSVGYLQVGFAIGWQYLVFAQLPTSATVVGALLIVLGTLVVARASQVRTPRPSPG